jgi:hypothetical protein
MYIAGRGPVKSGTCQPHRELRWTANMATITHNQVIITNFSTCLSSGSSIESTSMPSFPMSTGEPQNSTHHATLPQSPASDRLKPPASVQAKNRRKRYLDQHPEYFSADLEMAGLRSISLPYITPRQLRLT